MKTHTRPEPETSSPLKTKRILVPLDFSGTAAEALAYAVALAKFMRAKIVLLHVIEPAYAGPEPGFGYAPLYTESQQTSSRKQMHHVAAKFIPRGFFEKAIVRVGSPFHEIASTAGGLNASLIVLTTHGRTGLSHLLMGSTAERVVRNAPCPVLTLRRATPQDPARKKSQNRGVRGGTARLVATTRRRKPLPC